MIQAPLAPLRAAGGEIASFGAQDVAKVVVATIDRADDALARWWNQPLALKDAAEWGGYSESQLRRLIAGRTVPVAPDGRIRRKDVPVRPGHTLPLGLEPEPQANSDWADELKERREQAAGR